MKVKKFGIVIEAVTIVLLMVSSATAMTTVLQSNEDSNSGIDVINYVEPGIHISVTQKIILKSSLKYVDDPVIRFLLQEIINKKGPVDSSDIEQIINDNDLEVGTITIGGIATGGSGAYPGTSGGAAFCPRRPLCGIIVPLPFVGLVGFHAFYQESWDNNPDYPVQITIGGKFINYEIYGLAIGFFGWVGTNTAPNMGFRCNGAAILIIYS